MVRTLRGQTNGSPIPTATPITVVANLVNAATSAPAEPASPADTLASRFPELTRREAEVLALIVAGLGNADIAARLYLSAATVRNYLSSAIGKTGTRNKVEAARAARENGWL